MEEKLTEILNKTGIHKKLATTLALVSIALIKSSKLSIRSMADFIKLSSIKQSKVNRIWRLFNKSKLFNSFIVMKALFNISIKLSKEKLIVIDFTDLKGNDIKLFIASVVTKGRTLPFYCKVLNNEDINNMRYKSENEFIMKSIEEIMDIIPEEMRKEIVILGDRQFGRKILIEYFREKEIKFLIRIRKNIKMGIKIKKGIKKEKKGEELKRGKYKVEIEGEEYEAYIEEKGGEKLIAITNKRIKGGLKRGVREYLKRSRCEQMHRDIKERLNLLFLNRGYFKRMGEDKIIRYVVVIMISEIVGIWIGKIAEKKGIKRRLKSSKDEKSLYHLGEVIIKQIDIYKDIIRSFSLSISKLFPLSDYR